MPAGTLPISHIRLDEHGRAWLAGTQFEVLRIAMDHLQGLSPEEIRQAHYGALTLGQIHAALAHYFDHKPVYDAEIDRQLAEYERLWSEASESPFRKRLRAQGIRQ